MNLQSRIIPVGHPNRPGIKLEAIKAIVIHYTANDAPTATDTANAAYFGRVWKKGDDGKPLEADGKTPFRYGSTQIVADEDSVTIAIPPDEAAWACGDRNAGPWTPALKGQTAIARDLFGFRQNYQSVSVEICNNRDWDRAVANAAEWCAAFIRNRKLNLVSYGVVRPGDIVILRHFDITGKACPKPFIDNPGAWTAFVNKVADLVRA